MCNCVDRWRSAPDRHDCCLGCLSSVSSSCASCCGLKTCVLACCDEGVVELRGGGCCGGSGGALLLQNVRGADDVGRLVAQGVIALGAFVVTRTSQLVSAWYDDDDDDDDGSDDELPLSRSRVPRVASRSRTRAGRLERTNERDKTSGGGGEEEKEKEDVLV